MQMPGDNPVFKDAPGPQIQADLPVWHRPAIWRMPISETLNGSSSFADAANSSNS
jgi:hypothetical protein